MHRVTLSFKYAVKTPTQTSLGRWPCQWEPRPQARTPNKPCFQLRNKAVARPGYLQDSVTERPLTPFDNAIVDPITINACLSRFQHLSFTSPIFDPCVFVALPIATPSISLINHTVLCRSIPESQCSSTQLLRTAGLPGRRLPSLLTQRHTENTRPLYWRLSSDRSLLRPHIWRLRLRAFTTAGRVEMRVRDCCPEAAGCSGSRSSKRAHNKQPGRQRRGG